MFGTFQYCTTYYFQHRDLQSQSLALDTTLWSSLFTKDFIFFYQET